MSEHNFMVILQKQLGELFLRLLKEKSLDAQTKDVILICGKINSLTLKMDLLLLAIFIIQLFLISEM